MSGALTTGKLSGTDKRSKKPSTSFSARDHSSTSSSSRKRREFGGQRWTALCSEKIDCRLDVDEDDNPVDGIVLVGLPVGSSKFVEKHLLEKAEKIDTVLSLVARLGDAQITIQIHRACLSVVLFNCISRTTPLAQTRRRDKAGNPAGELARQDLPHARGPH